ncbi:toxic anion resistance protein [Sphingomonas aurantiaca]|uniref:toxic anion resistance protein n=1 Tax=Sphingomonas aurantiaca TaxID=185949 RepID=UPI002FDFF186
MTTMGDEPASANRTDRLGPIAVGIVRGWDRRDVAVIAAEVDAVGLRAVEMGTKAISRLSGLHGPEASQALATLAVVVDAIEDPPRPRWSFSRSASTHGRTPMPLLVAMIERERDEALRRTMTLREDRRRLVSGDDALEDALTLLGLLDAGAVSVAREVAVDDPTRAQLLRTEVRGRLSERRRDLQLQLLVVRQALATHDLVADGQTALVEALDRARSVTIGAARTAVAARRAVGADPSSDDAARRRGTPLTDVVARLNAVLDVRERG